MPICIAALLFFLVSSTTAGPASVTFVDSATVAGPDVSLGEIATVFCEDSDTRKKLEAIVVSRYLAPHRSRLLSSAPIEAMLRRDTGQDLIFGNSGKITVRADTREIPGDTLRQNVTDYIRRAMPWSAGHADVRITDCPERVFVRNGPYALVFSHDAKWDLRGAGRIRVEVVQNQIAVRSFQVGATITVQHEVCVALNPIKRDARIRREDLVIERVDISRMRHNSFDDPAQLIGLQACRTISKGRVIDGSMIRMPPAVEAGSAVRIVIVCGSARVIAEGISRGSGAIGDRIQVYCPMTRKVLRGQIQADSTIVIESGRRKA